MSDCVKCWDTPCTCGWGYKHLTKEQRIERAAVVLGVEINKLDEKISGFVPETHPMKTKS
jgi:hypothetical protein